ncbi:MAG: hypothetical protein ACREQZ_05760 [Woeseiaceae bacterium]
MTSAATKQGHAHDAVLHRLQQHVAALVLLVPEKSDAKGCEQQRKHEQEKHVPRFATNAPPLDRAGRHDKEPLPRVLMPFCAEVAAVKQPWVGKQQGAEKQGRSSGEIVPTRTQCIELAQQHDDCECKHEGAEDLVHEDRIKVHVA